jgi:UDP-N-acetylglucosamine--N-acetylmuramyl-(pentapeptide) pyrophosphoryl-undecaprenol N-acetylglucosamine transferase
LLTLFNERKRVSPLKRLFGGDFEQVGFIRRNIITALIRINQLSPEIEKALLAGFEDPYYEVRAESARAAAIFGNRLSSTKTFVLALLKLLGDPNIDVSAAAAEALGKLGGEQDALPALLQLWDSRLWKVRAAALHGLMHLVDRGKVSNLNILEEQAPRFILTSTDFKPHFEIKFGYRRLMESVARKKEKSVRP